jgi:transglutaminase-like putative cysteine protease
VCQDFSHVLIMALRSLGIPAGYVSGFLRTIPPPGKERLEGADAMHAWVRVWCGEADGYIELDPTNDIPAGSDHIVVGYGRDYADVAPVIGVLKSYGNQKITQAVDVVPVS